MTSVGLKYKLGNRSAYGVLLLGLLALLLMLGYQLKLSHASALARAADDADNLAFTLDGQITTTLRRIEATLNLAARQLPAEALVAGAADRQRDRVHAILAPMTRNFPEVLGLFVWSKEGEILYDTVSNFPLRTPYSIAHRPGFEALVSNPAATVAFSDAIRSRLTGHQTVAIYVPVRDASGHLQAVVTATLNLDYLAQVFHSLRLGERSVVYIRRSDNHKLVIRDPQRVAEINQPISNSIQRRIDAGELAGRDRFKAVTDGEYRLLGFRKLTGFPFYVAVGVSENDALAGWHRNIVYVTSVLLLLILALALTLLRARQMEQQMALARQEAGKAHQLLQEAIDSISAGLVIYDPQDRLVLSNQAQQQLFEGIADLLVPGQTFAEIVREGARRGVFAGAAEDADAWVAQAIKHHSQCDGHAFEEPLADGRWVQISEHRTPGGYIVGSRIDITERKQLENGLKKLATVDSLTGLPNRRHFMSGLEEELERVQRGTTRQACVLMLDLDHFKNINDSCGHAAGDRVLLHFSDLLREQMRPGDTSGRIGGEEFAIILPGMGLEEARNFAERLRCKLEASPVTIDAQTIQLTVSIGITSLLSRDGGPDSVLQRADKALYKAKEQGRNRIVADTDT